MTPYSGEGAVGEQRFALPWPPSSNSMFLNVRGKGRVRTPAYRAWQMDAGMRLNTQHPVRYTVPVSIVVELRPPNNRACDADNRAKAPVDLLVKHGVIFDDNRAFVKEVTTRFADGPGAECLVIVRPA